jgi:hypothetical protein
MWVRRLFQRMRERRQAPRVQTDGLVAYYWTGSITKPKVVRDIGLCGACIIAADSFYPRTVVQIIFEDADKKGDDGLPAPHICVCGRVCRKTSDGFCVEFLISGSQERLHLRRFLNGLKRKDPVDTVAATAPDRATAVEPEEGATLSECQPESEGPEHTETKT